MLLVAGWALSPPPGTAEAADPAPATAPATAPTPGSAGRAPEWDIVKPLDQPDPKVVSAEAEKVAALAKSDSLSSADRALIRQYVQHLFALATDKDNVKRPHVIFAPLSKLKKLPATATANPSTETFQRAVGEAVLLSLDSVMDNNMQVRINALILASSFPIRPMAPYMAKLLAVPEQLEGVQYMAVKVLGRIASQGRMGVREENDVLDALLDLYVESLALSPLVREQVLVALGDVARPDSTGTEYARANPGGDQFTIGQLLCDAARDDALTLRARMIACESLSRLKAGPTKGLRSITRSYALLAVALCDEMTAELGRLQEAEQSDLEGLQLEAELGLRKARRLDLMVYAHNLLLLVDRLKARWKNRAASLAKLQSSLKPVVPALGQAYLKPEDVGDSLTAVKGALEKWLQDNPA